MQEGLETILRGAGLEAVVARQGSAFCIYFMDHCPRDWHDLAASHNNELDQELRRKLIGCGIYFFPGRNEAMFHFLCSHQKRISKTHWNKIETVLSLVSR